MSQPEYYNCCFHDSSNMYVSEEIQVCRILKAIKNERRQSINRQTYRCLGINQGSTRSRSNSWPPPERICAWSQCTDGGEKEDSKTAVPLLDRKDTCSSNLQTNNDSNCECGTGSCKQPLPWKTSKDDETDKVHIHIPDNETAYTAMFQKYFVVGASLKKEIAKELKKISGVESASVGFSTERDDDEYWPVIRVMADEKTCEVIKQDEKRKKLKQEDKEVDKPEHEECKKTLTHEVTAALKEVLTRIHNSKSWDKEELKNTIEIVTNYPLQEYELCSAGDVVKTTYCDNRGNQIDRKQGTMGYSVCHNVTIGNNVHTSHYEITGLHPVIPSRSRDFKQMIDPLPQTCPNIPLDTTAKHEYISKCTDSDIALATSTQQDPAQVHTCLRSTVFPRQAKNAFQQLRQKYGYTSHIQQSQAVPPTQEQAELVVGKTGLVKHLMTNDEDEEKSYEYNIVGNKLQNHPCNIDIAVLKYTDQSRRHTYSIKESFTNLKAGKGVNLPPSITWCGPPETGPERGLEERKGKVVYIANRTVYHLSDRLIKFNDPPLQPDEYPACVWYLNPAHNVTVPQGHSGAPVFLMHVNQNGDSTAFHLLGNLITKTSASPVRYSLDMVHDEIAINHIKQILDSQMPYYSHDLGSDMIERRLRRYKQYLTWHSEHQSLTPLMEERHIHCELSIYMYIPPHHDDCFYFCLHA